MAELEANAARELANLTAAEARASDRCRLVQQAIDADPTARLLLFARAYKRPSVLRYVLVVVMTAVLGVVMQIVSPQCLCLEGLKNFLGRLGRQ